MSETQTRFDEAVDRLYMHGILDEIYEHAYREGRGETVGERDASVDAETIVCIVLGRDGSDERF